jgi:hypothetical protein
MTIMYNNPEYGLHSQKNMEVRSVFAINWRLLGKPKANTFGF